MAKSTEYVAWARPKTLIATDAGALRLLSPDQLPDLTIGLPTWSEIQQITSTITSTIITYAGQSLALALRAAAQTTTAQQAQPLAQEGPPTYAVGGVVTFYLSNVLSGAPTVANAPVPFDNTPSPTNPLFENLDTPIANRRPETSRFYLDWLQALSEFFEPKPKRPNVWVREEVAQLATDVWLRQRIETAVWLRDQPGMVGLIDAGMKATFEDIQFVPYVPLKGLLMTTWGKFDPKTQEYNPSVARPAYGPLLPTWPWPQSIVADSFGSRSTEPCMDTQIVEAIYRDLAARAGADAPALLAKQPRIKYTYIEAHLGLADVWLQFDNTKLELLARDPASVAFSPAFYNSIESKYWSQWNQLYDPANGEMTQLEWGDIKSALRDSTLPYLMPAAYGYELRFDPMKYLYVDKKYSPSWKITYQLVGEEFADKAYGVERTIVLGAPVAMGVAQVIRDGGLQSYARQWLSADQFALLDAQANSLYLPLSGSLPLFSEHGQSVTMFGSAKMNPWNLNTELMAGFEYRNEVPDGFFSVYGRYNAMFAGPHVQNGQFSQPVTTFQLGSQFGTEVHGGEFRIRAQAETVDGRNFSGGVHIDLNLSPPSPNRRAPTRQ